MNCELQSKENELDRAKKEKDVEYKTKEAGCLDQAVTELSSVGDGVQSKHDVIHSYLGELRKLCIVEPETYAEHTMRRKAERVPRVVPPLSSRGRARNSCIDTYFRETLETRESCMCLCRRPPLASATADLGG